MEGPIINVLLSTFAGLGLPRTLSLPLDASTTVHDALETIYRRVPGEAQALVITTTSNKQLRLSDEHALSNLLYGPQDDFLPLRLSASTHGGKGGFGSQLRAAGGRMSSRKKRNQQDQPQNGSNRNLDGRRLRTFDVAKNLANYLARQPEMEQKEKEEQKKRWQATIDAAEATAEKIRTGNAGGNQGRLAAEYVESKELAEERTREAVVKAMREGILGTERTGSESSMDVDEEGSEVEDEDEEESESSSAEEPEPSKKEDGMKYFGWDEYEDDDSEESEEDVPVALAEPVVAYEGKGKAKAV